MNCLAQFSKATEKKTSLIRDFRVIDLTKVFLACKQTIENKNIASR